MAPTNQGGVAVVMLQKQNINLAPCSNTWMFRRDSRWCIQQWQHCNPSTRFQSNRDSDYTACRNNSIDLAQDAYLSAPRTRRNGRRSSVCHCLHVKLPTLQHLVYFMHVLHSAGHQQQGSGSAIVTLHEQLYYFPASSF